jgi:membrane protein
MNLPVASILVLFYTLVAWVCVWNIIVNRRADADEPALHTHLIGIILGAVAAFGIFLIGATTVLPAKDDEVNRSMNILGRFILVLYICTLGGSRNQNLATALKATLNFVLVRIHPPSAQIRRTPQRSHSHQPLQSPIEKRLGMSPGRFFDERIGDHTLLWVALLALGIWGYTLYQISRIRDIGTTEMILTAGLSLIGIGGMFFIALCIQPLLYLIAIIMMPFAALSVLVETGLRIFFNRPYDPWL